MSPFLKAKNLAKMCKVKKLNQTLTDVFVFVIIVDPIGQPKRSFLLMSSELRMSFKNTAKVIGIDCRALILKNCDNGYTSQPYLSRHDANHRMKDSIVLALAKARGRRDT